MNEKSWIRVGQWAAWLATLAFVIGIIGYMTWSNSYPSMVGLAPAQAAAVKFQYMDKAYGAFLISQLPFLLGMWMFAVIGRSLRALFNDDSPRPVLMAMAFFAAAMFGSVAQFLDTATTTTAHTLVPQVTGDALSAVALTFVPARATAEWALNCMILLFGVGALIAAHLVLTEGKLPRGWAYLSIVYGLLGIVNIVGVLAEIQPLNMLGYMGAMLLSPVWAFTLGLVWMNRMEGVK